MLENVKRSEFGYTRELRYTKVIYYYPVMKPPRDEATLPRDEATPRGEATPGARHSLRARLTRMFTPCYFNKPSLGLFLRPGQITCRHVWGRIHAPRARINCFSLLLSCVGTDSRSQSEDKLFLPTAVLCGDGFTLPERG